jgi:DNA-binding MarR family transcriptional regulator/N-acetylglutamate synthase-like GNAT family acetyltransferase
MPISANSTNQSEQVSAMREFNRFYTKRLGLLRRRHLDGDFSLTEARILYEIGSRPELTASSLRNTLGLDAGYISRLLTLLTRRKLVRQTASKEDGREKLLTLSHTGAKKLAQLNEQSALQIEELLEPLSAAERETLIESLSKVRSILSEAQKPAIRIVRLSEANDDAYRLLEEYYDAVGVIQRDTPEAIQQIIGAASSGMWVAYLRKKAVGCVILRRLSSIPFAGECKRLYVRPEARRNGLADALLDAQEAFARSKGLQWIYLDSYDDLKTAIALYRKRGYLPCERYNDNPQATVFLRKNIGGRQS